VSAQLDLIEPMGSETYLHLDTGGTRFIARVPPTNRHQVNTRLQVAVDLGRLHLFAPGTGEAIRGG
jgi:multiple sugar transport system ATP-binding protein